MAYEYKHNRIARDLINERMKKEGRYPLFLSLRAHLRAPPVNVPDKGSKNLFTAALILRPLDGSDPEIPMTGELGLFIEKYRQYPMEGLPLLPPINENFPAITDFRKESVPESPLREQMAEDVKVSRKKWKDDWERLRKGMSPDQKADAAECLIWALRNESCPAEELKPEDVPDPMAITVLKYMRSGGLSDLMRIGFQKLMPDLKQQDANAMKDNNDELHDLVGDFRRSVQEETKVEEAA